MNRMICKTNTKRRTCISKYGRRSQPISRFKNRRKGGNGGGGKGGSYTDYCIDCRKAKDKYRKGSRVPVNAKNFPPAQEFYGQFEHTRQLMRVSLVREIREVTEAHPSGVHELLKRLKIEE